MRPSWNTLGSRPQVKDACFNRPTEAQSMPSVLVRPHLTHSAILLQLCRPHPAHNNASMSLILLWWPYLSLSYCCRVAQLHLALRDVLPPAILIFLLRCLLKNLAQSLTHAFIRFSCRPSLPPSTPTSTPHVVACCIVSRGACSSQGDALWRGALTCAGKG